MRVMNGARAPAMSKVGTVGSTNRSRSQRPMDEDIGTRSSAPGPPAPTPPFQRPSQQMPPARWLVSTH
jgi:hypothetical protein